MLRQWLGKLYVQVLIAVAIGVVLGHFQPDLAAKMRPLGDGFIALVKMVIAPVIFLTIVVGMARMGDLRHSGRIGLKALIYFEVLTTLALVIGLLVANLAQPGAGMQVQPGDLDPAKTEAYRQAAKDSGIVSFILGIIPKTLVSAFTGENLLQVLLVAVLFGVAMTHAGAPGRRVLDFFDDLSHVLFKIVAIVMRAAPVGVTSSPSMSFE